MKSINRHQYLASVYDECQNHSSFPSPDFCLTKRPALNLNLAHFDPQYIDNRALPIPHYTDDTYLKLAYQTNKNYTTNYTMINRPNQSTSIC